MDFKISARLPLMVGCFFILLALTNCNIVGDGILQETLGFDKGFIHAQGNQLRVGEDDAPIVLRGVDFTNLYWLETTEALLNSFDHRPIDFQRVADMGMNVIRFSLNYRMFEKDERPFEYIEAGFDWLDREIELARQNGLYLILDMHIPQGGFQSTATGLDLWTDSQTRARLAALWKEIASRYRDEPTIAGFDLVNEPTPPNSKEEWATLAQHLIDEIRSVDINHMIVVEAVRDLRNVPGGEFPQNAQVLVDDDNVMYDFHFYLPFEYTHQLNPESGTPDGGRYPDPETLQFPQDLEFVRETPEQPSVPTGNSDWAFYTGALAQVTDPQLIVGNPIFDSYENAGRVFFDDFVVNEYDAAGQFLRQVMAVDITSAEGWEPVSEDPDAIFALSNREGHHGRESLSIAAHNDSANWFFNDGVFPVRLGHHYQISGWMKGENVSQNANARMTIGFSKSLSNTPVLPRDKRYLAFELDRWLSFGARHHVPMNVGEFGVFPSTFQDDKGGALWVQDMLDLILDRGVSFTFWAYHDPFGIHTNLDIFPDPTTGNQALINLFTNTLSKMKQ